MVIKQCNSMVESGKAFNNSKSDIKKVKDTKKLFDKISDDLDNAARRLDVNSVSKFVHAHFTYFHQGYDLMNDLESYMKDINDELDGLSIQFLVDKKEMEERHTLVQKRDEIHGSPGRSKSLDSLEKITPPLRSDRETYIKAKYVQHKYVMLDTFLRTCNRLDGSIIKNLARMKGHHDQKNAHAPLQRSDSTVGKLLQGLKISFKGERPERSRSCSTDVTSDSSGSAGGDSPKMPARKRSNSKSSGDKKHKAMHVLKNFSRGKKDIDSKFHRKKSADVNVDGDSNEQSVQKTNSDLRKTSGDDSMLSVSPTGDFTSRDVIDVGASICNTDHNEADGGESLDSLVCGSPVPPIATGDGSLSEDLHPLDLSVTVRDSHPVDLSGTGRYSPRTFASKVFEKHSPDLHVDDSIPKSESTDSALSDEGVVSVGSDDMQSDDRDEDALYRDDLEKAIEVLKILHPNRLLYKAAEWKSIPLMAAAFAEGGKANWVNEDDDSKLVLHQSVLGGSLTASEYLLQNGAKINMRDCRGRSALHYAALLGQTGYA
ncbi:hypothetical protein QZH41_003229 [Actinostola sp. cb2023]|nr:hypothetical protein QZH41_003229 [Actinostola sp. cb2023]